MLLLDNLYRVSVQLKSQFRQDLGAGENIRIRINPKPISKYPFYNFQFFCFQQHEIETGEKLKILCAANLHFSKSIFYFCMAGGGSLY